MSFRCTCGNSTFRAVATFCDLCGTPRNHATVHAMSNAVARAPHEHDSGADNASPSPSLAAPRHLEPGAEADLAARLEFPARLWDKVSAVLEKSRHSKHTARYMGEYYEGMATLVEKFATGLHKLAHNQTFITPTHHEGTTMQMALASVRSHTDAMGAQMKQLAHFLKTRVSQPLTRVRKDLSHAKAELEQQEQNAAKEVEKAKQRFNNLLAKQGKLMAKQREQPDPRREHELAQLEEEVATAQVGMFSRQNQYNQALSAILTRLQELELERIRNIQLILAAGVQRHREVAVDVASSFEDVLAALYEVSPAKDTQEFVLDTESGTRCPWIKASRASGGGRRERRQTSTSVSSLSTLEAASPERGEEPELEDHVDEDESKQDEAAEDAAVPERVLAQSIAEAPMPKDTGILPPALAWDMSHPEWQLAALETLLLFTGLGHDLDDAQYELVSNVLRVQMEMTRGHFLDMCRRIAMDATAEVSNGRVASLAQVPAEAMRSLHFRFRLLRTLGPAHFPHLASYQTWANRQLGVVWHSVVHMVQDHARETWELGASTNVPPLSTAQLLNRLLDRFFGAKDAAAQHEGEQAAVMREPSHKLRRCLDDIETTLYRVAELAAEGEAAGKEAPYSPAVLREMYNLLLSTCFVPPFEDGGEEAEPLDLDEEDDDDDDRYVTLHRSWEEIAALLLARREEFAMSAAAHYWALMREVLRVAHARTATMQSRYTNPFDPSADEQAQLLTVSRSPRLLEAWRKVHGWLSEDVEGEPRPADVLVIRRQLCAWLTDYHRCHEDLSAMAMHTLALSLSILEDALDDEEIARVLLQLVTQSSHTHFQRLVQGQSGLDDGMIPLPVPEWGSREWKRFGQVVLGAIDAEADLVAPAIKHARFLPTPGDGSLPVFARSFSEYVSIFFGTRASLERNVDRVAIDVFGATRRVTKRLLSVSKRTGDEALLSEAGKAALHDAEVVNDLPGLAHSIVSGMLAKQRKRVSLLVRRCVSVDKWVPVEVGGEYRYSSSVTDVFELLHAFTDSFFSYAAGLLPASLKEVEAFASHVNHALEVYVDAVADSCGSEADVRPKAALERRESLAEKSRAALSRMRERLMARSANDEVVGEEPVEPVGADVRPSLRDQGVAGLAARLACLHAAILQLNELAKTVAKKMGELHHASAEQAANEADSDEEEEADAALAQDFGAERFEAQINALFEDGRDALSAGMLRVESVLAARLVFVDLSRVLADGLYKPTPSAETSMEPALDLLDGVMQQLYPRVYEPQFVSLSISIFQQMVDALVFVLVDAPGRQFSPQHGKMLQDDLALLQDMFAEELEPSVIAATTARVNGIVATMKHSSEELVEMYQLPSKRSDVDPETLVRILRRRGDKAAKAFVKRL